ncbi:carboxylesterase family protein [Streptomyces sp. MBT65]|uniref:carboxylesterase family protein n=1 Tax=Streptomyces sp. MBT65 TaxID=1488395 RepID=UPI002278EB49|nr:carboxylesterase family protein [Streptomyces sp. MBT65]
MTSPLRTDTGRVSGVASMVSGVTVFKGLPYAATSAGANRWRPPQRTSPWTGVRVADTFVDICPQRTMSSAHLYFRRAKSSQLLFGGPALCMAQLRLRLRQHLRHRPALNRHRPHGRRQPVRPRGELCDPRRPEQPEPHLLVRNEPLLHEPEALVTSAPAVYGR